MAENAVLDDPESNISLSYFTRPNNTNGQKTMYNLSKDEIIVAKEMVKMKQQKLQLFLGKAARPVEPVEEK